MSYFTVKIEEGAKAHLGKTLQIHEAPLGGVTEFVEYPDGSVSLDAATAHYNGREYWATLAEKKGGACSLELSEKDGRSRLNFPSVTIL